LLVALRDPDREVATACVLWMIASKIIMTHHVFWGFGLRLLEHLPIRNFDCVSMSLSLCRSLQGLRYKARSAGEPWKQSPNSMSLFLVISHLLLDYDI